MFRVSHKSEMAKIIEAKFGLFEIAKLQRTYQIMQQGIEQRETHLSNFWRFFRTHDARRNTDLLKTFPEYENFFKECQNAK